MPEWFFRFYSATLNGGSRWPKGNQEPTNAPKPNDGSKGDQEMTDAPVHAEIDRLLESIDGELTSHSRVIDALLDLRAAADDVKLIAVIDESLRTVPGRTAVSTDWFKTQLTTFRLMVDVQSSN